MVRNMPPGSTNYTFTAPQNPTEIKSAVFTAVGALVVAVTMAVTIIGDCLIFAAFLCSTSIRTRANLFFLSLITADILQAFTVMPLELVRIVDFPLWPFGVAATKVWNSMFVCFGTASASTLAAIGVERYLAISRPFFHSAVIISNKALAGLCLVWFYAISSGILSFFAWKTPDHAEADKSGFSISLCYGIPLLIFDNLVPLITCVMTYTLIFRISLDHSYRLGLLCGWTLDGHSLRISKDRKTLRTLSLLVGTFTACSLPFFVFHAVDSAYEEGLPYRQYASYIVKWMCYVNSACNWALYSFLNQDFRDVLFAVCKKGYFRIHSALCFTKANRVAPL